MWPFLVLSGVLGLRASCEDLKVDFNQRTGRAYLLTIHLYTYHSYNYIKYDGYDTSSYNQVIPLVRPVISWEGFCGTPTVVLPVCFDFIFLPYGTQSFFILLFLICLIIRHIYEQIG